MMALDAAASGTSVAAAATALGVQTAIRCKQPSLEPSAVDLACTSRQSAVSSITTLPATATPAVAGGFTFRRWHDKRLHGIGGMRSARLLLSTASTLLARAGGGLIEQAGPPITQQGIRCVVSAAQCLQPQPQLHQRQQQQQARRSLGTCLLQQQQQQWRGAWSSGWTPQQHWQPHASSSGDGGGAAWPSQLLQPRRVFHAAAYHASRNTEYKMESLLIFDSCWRRFEERYGVDFRVPREIVWLNGAPGSGKGVNTQHILKTRGLTKHFTISGLLESYPEARRLVDAGEMIPDQMVGDLLLEALLLDEPGLQDDLGFVVDGFPRTATQVDFLKLLYDKLLALHHEFADTPQAIAFPRPSFKVVVLYVDEETSIKRQLQRARVANLHNRRVLDAGAGHFYEERSTDTDIDKCRKRYGIFKTHYAATLRLKQFFPFTLIDAMGSLEETRQQITNELRYQSSLDLGSETYELIRHLPLAKDVVLSARQELVMRLDGYSETSNELFSEVVDRIINDVLPVIRQSGLAGHAEYVTRSPFFTDHPVAVDMLVDVLTDRGFHVCYIREDVPFPESVDLATGAISCGLRPTHKFRISFDARGPRDDIKALEIAARLAESTNPRLERDVRISHSVIPEHFLDTRTEEDEEMKGSRAGGRIVGFMGS